jgi:hypothetical protein
MSDQAPEQTTTDKLATVAGAIAKAITDAAPANSAPDPEAIHQTVSAVVSSLAKQSRAQTTNSNGDAVTTTQSPIDQLLSHLGGGPVGWIETELLQVLGAIGFVLAALPTLGQIELREAINDLSQQHAHVPLSPADAADAVERSLLSFEDGAKYASMSQVGTEVFAHMVDLTGEPPGPMDLLSLWRRGIIDEDQLVKAIQFSRIRNDFIPWVLELAHSYVSPLDVVDMAVKGVLDLPTAKRMYGVAGGIEDQFEMVYEAAGSSIGEQQAMYLWNHGEITEAQVDEVLGRSRINPMFYDIAKKTRHKYLTTQQIITSLRAGTVNPDDALKWLMQDGLPASQAQALVMALHNGAHGKAKTETESQILQQYELHLLDESEAHGALVQIGYSDHDATMLVRMVDAKRAASQVNLMVGKVRAAYLAGHIDRPTAGVELDRLGIPPKARDAWLGDWDTERHTSLKSLTSAQVGSLAKKGHLTYQDAYDRWVAMGYSPGDAQLLVLEYGGPLIAG